MSTKRWAGEKLDAQGFKDTFGLSAVAEDKAYQKDSSTGTKQVAALGTYMTKDDYNRLKNDDNVWDAYAQVRGESAMEEKRERGDMSLNTLDALMDDLSAGKADKPVEETTPEPTKLSNTANKALAYTEAYESFARDPMSDDNPISGRVEMQAGNLGARQKFMDSYKLNLQKRMEPGTADEYGADDLGPNAFTSKEERGSQIASAIVNKNAGFGPV